MRLCVVLTVLAIAWPTLCAPTSAHAQASSIPCDAFAKNADGSWTVLATTYIEGPNVRVRRDAILQPGFLILGYDVAAMIAKACPNAKVAQPADAQAQQAQQQSPSLFATYADANGNYDVNQLTCGHLDVASPNEAKLFLAWYSGWYNGLAKGRGINLARVRYNIQNVIDYCKANRDKRLTDVMQLMLK
ncbi:MAG TPA: HdeA/HdeB family chaperone [Xanthobacteraceae bacterium]|nr:HdeA/HdeB family chaperone [Xanthobacteraceae bacterium]